MAALRFTHFCEFILCSLLSLDEGASCSRLQRCFSVWGSAATQRRWSEGCAVSAAAPPSGTFPPANLDRTTRATDRPQTPGQTGEAPRENYSHCVRQFPTTLSPTLSLQRMCRRLLALYDLPSWGRCELVLSLLQEPDISYSLEDVVQAVKESHDKDFIRRLLNNECPCCLSIFPLSKVGRVSRTHWRAHSHTRVMTFVSQFCV